MFIGVFMNKLIRFYIILLSVFITGLLSGCATSEKNLNTPEGLFAQAKEFEEGERFDIAISKYNDVRNKFPYSPMAIEAELAIADAQYKRENYVESQIYYQNFRDLHPKHKKIDYVVYRTAMSYYMQLPETIDRDLTLGNDAIYHFDEVIKSYPQSEYYNDAKMKKQDVLTRLAEKELYIADFYFKNQQYGPAMKRYEQCLSKFSGIGLDPRAHLGALKSAKALANSEKQNLHFKELTSKYPQSKEAHTASSERLNQ